MCTVGCSLCFICCNLLKTVFLHVFPFVCAGVRRNIYTSHPCVSAAADVSPHKLLRLYQVNFFWRNTSWPSRLLLGCHITHCSGAAPIICHSAYLALMPRDTNSLYCSFLWEEMESSLSSLNTASTFKLCSTCFFPLQLIYGISESSGNWIQLSVLWVILLHYF